MNGIRLTFFLLIASHCCAAAADTATSESFTEFVREGATSFISARYRISSERIKTKLAWQLYTLGWKSLPAGETLLSDIASKNMELRIAVQYALGRVSNDRKVRLALQNIVTGDEEFLLRDKAGCALANDQVHASPREKFEILQAMIRNLESSDPISRDVSIRVIEGLTGQTKKYDPYAPEAVRAQAIETWKSWIIEYEKEL